MSRKKKILQQQLPVDTGGLDLSLPPQTPPAEEEPALDVLAAPSNAHKAVEELETLPPAVSLQTFFVPDEVVQDIALENGMSRLEAIHSTLLFMAVRKTNVPGALVITNGTRFWTVDDQKLEPALFEGIQLVDGYRESPVWRPVRGNERGWFVG